MCPSLFVNVGIITCMCLCVCVFVEVRSSYYYGRSCSGTAVDCRRCAGRLGNLKGFLFEWQAWTKYAVPCINPQTTYEIWYNINAYYDWYCCYLVSVLFGMYLMWVIMYMTDFQNNLTKANNVDDTRQEHKTKDKTKPHQTMKLSTSSIFTYLINLNQIMNYKSLNTCTIHDWNVIVDN